MKNIFSKFQGRACHRSLSSVSAIGGRSDFALRTLPPGRLRSFDERKASGFSLIEVLVATALLVMIVGMIGFVFRQSSMSWDSGIRRAEGIAQVRAVAGAIERDLRLAVDAREFGLTQSFSDGALKFVIPADRDETSQKQKRDRALMQIEYSSGKTVKRTATRLMRSSGSWGPKGTAKTSTLMSPSDSSASTSPEISFDIMPDDNDKNGLPIYVSVYADIRVNESFSGLEVRSYGPNGKKNASGKSDGDDIVVK